MSPFSSRYLDFNLTDNSGVNGIVPRGKSRGPNIVQRLLEVVPIDTCRADSRSVTPKGIATMHDNMEAVKILENLSI